MNEKYARTDSEPVTGDSVTRAQSSLDEFRYWLADMDGGIERFRSLFPEDVRQRLDYTAESLDIVEDFLLKRYSSYDKARSSGESVVFDGAACYVGETLRKNLGGHWTINVDKPKDVFFGIPALVGFKGSEAALAPLTLATAATHRRTGSYLRTILENNRDG